MSEKVDNRYIRKRDERKKRGREEGGE